MKRRFTALAALICLFVTGCGKTPAPRYGPEINATRVKLRLPIIGPNWQNYNTLNNSIEAAWATPGSNTLSPNHAGKKVIYNSGQWEMEQDYYYSGKTGPSLDPDGGTEWEEIIVTYTFVPRAGYPKGWTCYHQVPGKLLENISVEEAERILASWGLKRLNY